MPGQRDDHFLTVAIDNADERIHRGAVLADVAIARVAIVFRPGPHLGLVQHVDEVVLLVLNQSPNGSGGDILWHEAKVSVVAKRHAGVHELLRHRCC